MVMLIDSGLQYTRPFISFSIISNTVDSFNNCYTLCIQGDWTMYFNSQRVYKVGDGNSQYYFRFGMCSAYQGNTIFNYVQWHDGMIPTIPGVYLFTEFKSDKEPKYARTMCMVGDSLTALFSANHFRNLLRDGGLQYEFIGMNTDAFGFRHWGNAGAGTHNYNLNKIPVADSYFVLLGTNDPDTPQDTVGRLMQLIISLNTLNPNAKINVSTLLLRADRTTPPAVNTILRTTPLPIANAKLIDLQAHLPEFPSWNNNLIDGIHPNYETYKQLIVPYLLQEIE